MYSVTTYETNVRVFCAFSCVFLINLACLCYLLYSSACCVVADIELLQNWQAALSGRRVWSAVWRGTRLLGTWCKSGSTFIHFYSHDTSGEMCLAWCV